jgi:hypothetical protein
MRISTISLVSAATITLVGALGAGCAVDASNGGQGAELSPASAIGREHLMLTESARAQLPPPAETERTGGSGHTLKYYGGPIIQNVNVIPVYWNSSVALQSNLNQFYSAIVTGTYPTFLSQYNTSSPSQKFGAGTRGTPYVATQTGTNVTDAQVQSFLTASFNSGALPKPTANNLYMVHFPPGVSITDSSGSKSCVVFCAYHGTGTYNGQDFFYGIIPDLGSGGCQSGCGTSTVLNNTTSVISHEYTEALTDPAVGLATTYSAPLGWYNATYGEIGDECNGQQTTAVLGDGKSYTVQKEWSNSANACATP